jgi:3',5'-cyclic AMP phosphodiesterase CpdA
MAVAKRRPAWQNSRMKITRRDALMRLGAGTLLAAGTWPGALSLRAGSPAGNFRFVVVNDLHYINEDCGRFLEGIMGKIAAEQPDFCLVAGDLTEKGQREHLAAMRDILGGLKLPYYPVIGNHDYNSAESNRYYRLFFPRRLNYWFEHAGWQFVGLDTSEGQKYEKTSVQPDTLQWLADHLGKLEPAKPTVIFTHFPLGPGVRYRPLNADAVLEPFKPFNLRAIYCGHFHGFTEKKTLSTVAFTNRCCALKRGNHDGTKEKGYFVCDAADGGVTTRFVKVAVPAQPATAA